jgi:hypothetical protein
VTTAGLTLLLLLVPTNTCGGGPTWRTRRVPVRCFQGVSYQNTLTMLSWCAWFRSHGMRTLNAAHIRDCISYYSIDNNK